MVALALGILLISAAVSIQMTGDSGTYQDWVHNVWLGLWVAGIVSVVIGGIML